MISSTDLPPFLRSQGTGVLLSVKVQPRAARTQFAGILGSELKIKVAAPPVDGAANEALVEFLAEVLGCPRRAVALVRGQASSHKVFEIAGMTPANVVIRIAHADGTSGTFGQCAVGTDENIGKKRKMPGKTRR